MNKIFVAYNTDSFIEFYKNTKKLNKMPSTENSNYIPDFYKSNCNFECTIDTHNMRVNAFKNIYSYYQIKHGKYELYFDILDNSIQNPNLYFHIDKNEKIIIDNNVIAILYVVADNETSFWQLQEAFQSWHVQFPCWWISDKEQFPMWYGGDNENG